MTEGATVTPSQYAHWRQTRLGRITERAETRLVFELAGLLDSKRVLDIGTGDGTYAIEAARRGADATGLDADRAMLATARARAGEHGLSLALREGRAEELPFGDGSFDVVLAVTVLCFVRDTRRAVREMARVLAPGGRLVVGELGRFSVWAAGRRVRAWHGSRAWRAARFHSRRQLRQLAEWAGLEVVALRGAVFFPPLRVAAIAMAPLDARLSRWNAPGAAFLALSARKPGDATSHSGAG